MKHLRPAVGKRRSHCPHSDPGVSSVFLLVHVDAKMQCELLGPRREGHRAMPCLLLVAQGQGLR